MPTQSPQWIGAARVLRRAACAATGAQIDARSGTDMAGYLSAALRSDPGAEPGALTTPMAALPDPGPRPGKSATASVRKQYNRTLADQMTELSTWWLRRMITVADP